MANKNKPRTTEQVEKSAAEKAPIKVEKTHVFTVLKDFTFDKSYKPSDVFESVASKTTNFLITNKFIK